MRRLLSGRGPLWVAGVLCLLALVALMLPTLLPMFSPNTPAFPHDDVRNASFAEGRFVDNQTARVVTWEPTGREAYRANPEHPWTSIIRSHWSQRYIHREDEVFSRDWAPTISMPNDGELEILVAVARTSGHEPIWLDPELQEIRAEDAKARLADFGLVGLANLAQSPNPFSYARFQFWAKAKGEFVTHCSRASLRDTANGYELAGSPWSLVETSSDGVEIRTAGFDYAVSPPGPLTLWLESVPPPTSYYLGGAPGSRAIVDGAEVILEDVIYPDENGWLHIFDENQGSTTARGSFAVAIDRPPRIEGSRSPRLIAHFQDGSSQVYSMSAEEWWIFDKGDPETVSEYEFEFDKSHRFLKIPVPDLEKLLGTSHSIEDLAAVAIPTYSLNGMPDLAEVLGAALESRVVIDGQHLSGLAPVGPAAQTWPLNTKGMNAGELLRIWRSQYSSEHAVLWANETRSKPYVTLTPPQYMWDRSPTFRSQALRASSNAWLILAILGGLLGALKLWSLIQAKRLHDHLRNRGYAWMGFFQAEWLYLLLGRRAWRIPAYDELGAVPHVTPDDVRSIARVMREAEEP
ncbi:hypothetical protein KQI84_04790 [bacterium]|nr:hypothetical protein [bacterium]